MVYTLFTERRKTGCTNLPLTGRSIRACLKFGPDTETVRLKVSTPTKYVDASTAAAKTGATSTTLAEMRSTRSTIVIVPTTLVQPPGSTSTVSSTSWMLTSPTPTRITGAI